MAKITLRVPVNGIEADVGVNQNEDGTVDIDISPYFYGQDSAANVAYLTTYNDQDQVICRTAVQVTGSKGSFKLVDVTKKVPPRFSGKKIRTDAPKAEPEKAVTK